MVVEEKGGGNTLSSWLLVRTGLVDLFVRRQTRKTVMWPIPTDV